MKITRKINKGVSLIAVLVFFTVAVAMTIGIAYLGMTIHKASIRIGSRYTNELANQELAIMHNNYDAGPTEDGQVQMEIQDNDLAMFGYWSFFGSPTLGGPWVSIEGPSLWRMDARSAQEYIIMIRDFELGINGTNYPTYFFKTEMDK
jgi:hypothetical protein